MNVEEDEKVKFISLLVTSYAAFTATALMATSAKPSMREQVAMKKMESRMTECRWLVQQLVDGNPRVMEQLDQLMGNLKQAYFSGEGLIDKDIDRILDAIAFSAEKHRFQTRKDREHTPYIIHPLGVANHLISIGRVRDPDVMIGALLHDTVEDTETTFEEIEQKFGLRVALFVQEVTDDKSLPKQLRKQLQVEHAPEKSAGAAQIKLADKLYNLMDLATSTPLGWDAERVHQYFQWAEAMVDHLPWVNAPLKQAVDEVIERYWQSQR
jgi:guanosine-3',5'-bis(diphosphate) 3'-pyrophosphohydrolase